MNHDPDLSRRLEALRQENDQLRAANRVLLTGYKAGGSLAALFLLGPNLIRAARDFFATAEKTNPVPPEESAALVAAFLRRLSLVGLLGLLIALLPSLLMYQQNLYLRDQNDKIQQQILAQAEDTWIVRRAQLLDTIVRPGPLRLQQEAILALIGLERRPELGRNVDLNQLDLRGISLPGAKLDFANLESSWLGKANLQGSDLRGANLRGANLRLANLENAKLAGADLFGTGLWGANLVGVKDLKAEQLAATCGDASTELPLELKPPRHWARGGGLTECPNEDIPIALKAVDGKTVDGKTALR